LFAKKGRRRKICHSRTKRFTKQKKYNKIKKIRTAVNEAKTHTLRDIIRKQLTAPGYEINTDFGITAKDNNNQRDRNELYPEKYTDITQGIKKEPHNGKSRYDELYGEHTKEGLDVLSNALAVASVVPGLDTFMDLAAVPVDLLRGDYVSAGLDLVGAVPFAGETADTARLAKLGFEAADVIKDADNAVDMARAMDKTGDVAKAVDTAEDLYTAAKVDGTIQSFLDAADDPIAELNKMSKSIAKTSPIQIPEGAMVKPQIKKGYYHMEYKWMADDGYEYKTRWHTRNPTAPIEQRDVWVVEQEIKGIGYGPNHRQGVHQVCVGENKWIAYDEWQKAATAKQLGFATEQQKEWLDYGHRKV